MEHWFDKLLQEYERTHAGERLSIRKLADKAKLDQTTIQRFKKGEGMNTKTLIAIAAVFGIEPGELLAIQQTQ